MDNFYSQISEKIKTYDSFRLEEGYYYLYFIKEFIPKIIEDRINDLQLQDITNIDCYRDIKLNFNLEFIESEENSVPTIKRTKDGYVINIPKNSFENVKNRILLFFKPILDVKDISEKNYCYKVNGSVYGLILSMQYVGYLSFDKKIANNIHLLLTNNERNLANILSNDLNSLNSYYVDRIHSKLFENIFLDSIVVRIIRENINKINQRNYQSLNANNIHVDSEVLLANVISKEYYLKLNKEEMSALAPLIDNFMRDYNLGRTSVIYGGHECVVTFDTSLINLIDAYYMEKQRIEHLTKVKEDKGNYTLKKSLNN